VQHLTLAREALASAFAKSQSSNAELQERLHALERELQAKKQLHQATSRAQSSDRNASGTGNSNKGSSGSGLLSELLAEANELNLNDTPSLPTSSSTRGTATGSRRSHDGDLSEKTKVLEQRLSRVKHEATEAARAAASREAALRKKLVSIEAENDLLHEEAEVLEAAVVQAEKGGGKGGRQEESESMASLKATTAEATKRALELARALNKATLEKEQAKKELVETQTLARSLHTRLVTAQRQNRMPAKAPTTNAATNANNQSNATGHVNGVQDLRPLVQVILGSCVVCF